MSAVCIDNHILIWGVRKKATPGQEGMILRAELFLDLLEERKVRIMVPAVVQGEFLVRVPADKHQEVLAVFEKRFQVVPYDSVAASWAAKIYQKHKVSGTSHSNANRDVLKADIQILATAVTRKASVLYTHDEDLTKLASPYLRVSQLPEGLAKQQPLL